MGAWGTGILQNDTTADVWAEFKQLYHLGNSIDEICKRLEEDYSPIDEQEVYADFWTGIAHGQWMCGEVTPEIIQNLNQCVQTGKGLELWKEKKSDFDKRFNTILEFIEKIQVPREKPLKRKKIVSCPAFFNKGDVISIRLEKNQFAFALVFEKQDEDEIDGGNRLVFSSIVSDSEISIENFMNSEVLYLDIGGENNYQRGYFWADFQARNMKRKIKNANVIGHMQLSDYLGLSNSVPYGDWNKLNELFNEQIQFQSSNKTRKPFKVSMSDFVRGENREFELELVKHALVIWKEKLNKINAT